MSALDFRSFLSLPHSIPESPRGCAAPPVSSHFSLVDLYLVGYVQSSFHHPSLLVFCIVLRSGGLKGGWVMMMMFESRSKTSKQQGFPFSGRH